MCLTILSTLGITEHYLFRALSTWTRFSNIFQPLLDHSSFEAFLQIFVKFYFTILTFVLPKNISFVYSQLSRGDSKKYFFTFKFRFFLLNTNKQKLKIEIQTILILLKMETREMPNSTFFSQWLRSWQQLKLVLSCFRT